jgi:hypothetical protein
MAWGHKITFVVYKKGEENENEILSGAEALEHVIPDTDFMGARVEVVEDAPNDQVAT